MKRLLLAASVLLFSRQLRRARQAGPRLDSAVATADRLVADATTAITQDDASAR